MPVLRDQRPERIQHVDAEKDHPRINVDAAVTVHRACCPQRLHALLVEEPLHVSVLPAQVHAVVFPGLHVFREADHRSARSVPLDLRRIKKQQNVAGKQQHSLRDALRDRPHRRHEFIEQRAASVARKRARHRAEELAERRVLRHAPAVPAAVDHEDPLPGKSDAILFQQLQRGQRRPAGADPHAALVRDHKELRSLWKKSSSALDLQPESLRLVFTARRQDHGIPERRRRNSLINLSHTSHPCNTSRFRSHNQPKRR